MNSLELSQQHLQGTLDAMGVSAQISQEEIGGEPALQVETAEQAILIGRGGDNLRALQYIIYQMVKRDLPTAEITTIDVAGYRKARLLQLETTVEQAKEQAKSSDEPITLAPMNAYERRFVHSILSDEPDLVTESTGQEPDRRVVIRRAS